MKNIIILLFIFLFILFIFLVFSNQDEVVENGEEIPGEVEENEIQEEEDGILDMQSYLLDVPAGYTCDGGFVQGYRYQDAECFHEDRDDYMILAKTGGGFFSTGEDPAIKSKVSVENYNLTRSLDATVCSQYHSETLRLDAEYYTCDHYEDEKNVIILGIVKDYPGEGYAQYIEAKIFIENENTNYERKDYVETLATFLNNGMKIDWEINRDNQ